MALIDQESGTTVLRRPADSRPPRTWRSWLIGRPLPTYFSDSLFEQAGGDGARRTT